MKNNVTSIKSVIETIFWWLATNVVAIVGVLYYGWNASSIVMMYLIETFIIGFLNFLKLRLIPGDKDGPFQTSWFFLIHYGIFLLVQTILILFLIDLKQILWQQILIWGVGVLLVSHIYYFVMGFYINGAYKTMNADEQMFQPYGRIFIQQFLAIFGVIFFLNDSQDFSLCIFLIVLKTVIEGIIIVYPFVRKEKPKSKQRNEKEFMTLGKKPNLPK